MAYDDQDDLFGEDFDFVDEDELDNGEFDDSTLDDSTPEDSTPEDSTPEDSTPEASEIVGTTARGRRPRSLPKQQIDQNAPTRPSEGTDEEPPGTDSSKPHTDAQDTMPTRGRRRPRRSKPVSATNQSERLPAPAEGAATDKQATSEESAKGPLSDGGDVPEEISTEPEGPPTDHVVHVYELGKFKRTIQREFTAEDAEAFALEYNRTSKPYGRIALAASREGEPAETL